jgi:hypothetical protein
MSGLVVVVVAISGGSCQGGHDRFESYASQMGFEVVVVVAVGFVYCTWVVLVCVRIGLRVWRVVVCS